jgi:chromosome segregation ATPase
LSERTLKLEEDMIHAQGNDEKIFKDIKGINVAMKVVQEVLDLHDHDDDPDTEDSSKKLEDLQLRQSNLTDFVKHVGDRISCMEANMSSFKGDVASDKAAFDSRIHGLQARINRTASEIEVLDKTSEHCCERITRVDTFAGKLLMDQVKVAELASSTEKSLEKLSGHLHNQTTTKIELNALEIRKTDSELHQAEKEIESTQEEVKLLKGELAATNVTLARLGTRFDSHNGSLQGLSKGFQDASRHVALGENGMLSTPRNTPARTGNWTLPGISRAASPGVP